MPPILSILTRPSLICLSRIDYLPICAVSPYRLHAQGSKSIWVNTRYGKATRILQGKFSKVSHRNSERLLGQARLGCSFSVSTFNPFLILLWTPNVEALVKSKYSLRIDTHAVYRGVSWKSSLRLGLRSVPVVQELWYHKHRIRRGFDLDGLNDSTQSGILVSGRGRGSGPSDHKRPLAHLLHQGAE